MSETAMVALLAGFTDEASLIAAAARLRAAGCGIADSYTPVALDGDGIVDGVRTGSRLPRIALAAGALVFAAALAAQWYGAAIDYPIDLGGRPGWSWPAYLPAAIDAGLLTAVATAFVGYFLAGGMPVLYDPVDGADGMGDASSTQYVLRTRPIPADQVPALRGLLVSLQANFVSRVPEPAA